MGYAKTENGLLVGWSNNQIYDDFVFFNNDEELVNLVSFGAKTFYIENEKATWKPSAEERATVEAREAEELEVKNREELLDSLPETLADADDAICELYETTIAQQAAMDEQDAAICELYELMIGSGE